MRRWEPHCREGGMRRPRRRPLSLCQAQGSSTGTGAGRAALGLGGPPRASLAAQLAESDAACGSAAVHVTSDIVSLPVKCGPVKAEKGAVPEIATGRHLPAQGLVSNGMGRYRNLTGPPNYPSGLAPAVLLGQRARGGLAPDGRERAGRWPSGWLGALRPLSAGEEVPHGAVHRAPPLGDGLASSLWT